MSLVLRLDRRFDEVESDELPSVSEADVPSEFDTALEEALVEASVELFPVLLCLLLVFCFLLGPRGGSGLTFIPSGSSMISGLSILV